MVLAAQVSPLEWGHDSSLDQASVSQCNLQPRVTLTRGWFRWSAGLWFSIHNGHCGSCPGIPGLSHCSVLAAVCAPQLQGAHGAWRPAPGQGGRRICRRGACSGPVGKRAKLLEEAAGKVAPSLSGLGSRWGRRPYSCPSRIQWVSWPLPGSLPAGPGEGPAMIKPHLSDFIE